MNCQSLFSLKSKNNICNCRLLKIFTQHAERLRKVPIQKAADNLKKKCLFESFLNAPITTATGDILVFYYF